MRDRTLDEDLKEQTYSLQKLIYSCRQLIEFHKLSSKIAIIFLIEKIIYLGDLVRKTEAELLRTPNFGRKQLNEIKELVHSRGLDLGIDLPHWYTFRPSGLASIALPYDVTVREVAAIKTIPGVVYVDAEASVNNLQGRIDLKT